MSSSGPPITLAVRVANHEKIISASGTKQRPFQGNLGYEGRVRYRTAADVRAIPNLQWAEWLRSGTVPFNEFSPERGCQMAMRTLINAHARRMGITIPRKRKPKKATNLELSEKVKEAYWLHVAAVKAERRKGLDD